MIVSARHKISIPVRKILVIQLGDIGDVVWAIPAFWALKDAFPHARLSVLVRNNNGEFLLDDFHIDGLLTVTREGVFSGLALLRDLRREKFDLLFDLRADERGAYLSFLSGAKMRAALYYDNLPWRNRAYTHLVDPPPAMARVLGAAEQSLKIIRGFGIRETTVHPRIYVADAMKEKMSKLLIAEKVDNQNGWVSINPFSRWSYKEWSAGKWMNVARHVWQKHAKPVIITGSAEEKKRADEMIAGTDFPVYNLAGKTTLREMAALLTMSHLHMGVDSAAPHIAAAVGVPTVTLYGPSDWRDWAPTGEKHAVVASDMDCSPCRKKGCDGKGISKCLDELPEEKVKDAVSKMLEKYSSVR